MREETEVKNYKSKDGLVPENGQLNCYQQQSLVSHKLERRKRSYLAKPMTI